jgi:hypothetical protein
MCETGCRSFDLYQLPLEYDTQQDTIDNQHQPIDGNDRDLETILSTQLSRVRTCGTGGRHDVVDAHTVSPYCSIDERDHDSERIANAIQSTTSAEGLRDRLCFIACLNISSRIPY